MRFWNAIGAVAAAFGLSLVAAGQGTTPTTCATPPTAVTAFQIERAVPLANALTTLTPNTPPSVLAAIAGGALEIRELDVYNPQTGFFTSTLFLVPPGSPLPSPAAAITAANTFAVGTIANNQIIASCKPTPSLLFVGTVASAAPNPFSASPVGAPSTFSLGYTLDNPAKFHDVLGTFAGLISTYSASASGTLTTTGGTLPGGGGGGGGTAPTIVVKFSSGSTAVPNTVTQTAQNPFFLDASGSTSTGGALTFAWSASPNAPVAFVGTGVAGQILVQFPGPGDYPITLKVTDAAGNSATFTITLEFTGSRSR